MLRSKLRSERWATTTQYWEKFNAGYRVVRDVPDELIRHTPPCRLARFILRTGGYVVWDTETTGLDDDAKIVSVGIVDETGETLVDTLINPGVPIPMDATDIHGVTDADVADAPTFEEAYPEIRSALRDKGWVIYNSAYDVPRLRYECERYYLPEILPMRGYYPEGDRSGHRYFNTLEYERIDCAMLMYSEFHGDWNDYWGNYSWQKLSTAASRFGIKVTNAHNALADAKVTYELLQKLALMEDRT